MIFSGLKFHHKIKNISVIWWKDACFVSISCTLKDAWSMPNSLLFLAKFTSINFLIMSTKKQNCWKLKKKLFGSCRKLFALAKVPNPMGCVNDSIISSPYSRSLCLVLYVLCISVKRYVFVSQACFILVNLFAFSSAWNIWHSVLSIYVGLNLCYSRKLA